MGVVKKKNDSALIYNDGIFIIRSSALLQVLHLDKKISRITGR